MRSLVTQEELSVEPLALLLHIERGQLRWFGHLFWMPPECLPTWRRSRGRPRTSCGITSPGLGMPRCPSDNPEELEEVSREREV